MPVMQDEEWKPGSFTKNYSWGPQSNGLKRLHEAIRVGFDGEAKRVSREIFRNRIAPLGRPDFIPMNFFLFNKIIDGVDYLLEDELVFQAINYPHSPHFDKLALSAFCLSYAGTWRAARPYQRRPALWAQSYVANRVGDDFKWNASRISADDIESFLEKSPNYIAQGARKVATNLNYLLHNGRIQDFSTRKIERWWVDGVFLSLDRTIRNRQIGGLDTNESDYVRLIKGSRYIDISGPKSLEKDLAVKHLSALYAACGGQDRFAEGHVKEIHELKLPEISWLLSNDTRPRGAVQPTNPSVVKSIPWACAWLAKYEAGFETIDADELETFDSAEFVRRRTRRALDTLKERNISPVMTSSELMKITRGE